MVGITRIFKPTEDKEKLTKLDTEAAEKAFMEDVAAYQRPEIIITRQTVRTRLLVRLLCLLTCFLFGCFLIIGGILLYRFYSAPREWYNVCNIRYRAPESGYLIDRGGLYADDFVDPGTGNNNGPIFKPKELDNDESSNIQSQLLGVNDDDNENNNGDSVDDDSEKGEFKQDLRLNMANQLEQITVPKFSQFRQATFLHDFTYNYSAIIDMDSNRCFIMELDRKKISPPKSIYEILKNTMNGYYLPENILLHQNLKVQMPALTDLTQFGENIKARCEKKDSYMLKKQHLIGANHEIDKRDASTAEKRCDFPFDFINSVGTFTLAYHLTC